MTKRTENILYSFRRCPYAMRGRMGLVKASIRCEVREIILRDKPAHMLEISPKGSVPVLLLPDDTVIDESLDIMFWALKQNDPDAWLEADQDETMALIERNDGPFKKALDRYKYPTRYPDEDCSGARDDGEAVVKDLNERIAKNGGGLVSDKATLADIAIFPFIRQFAHVDRDWFYGLPYPDIQKWLPQHLESELFKSIMKKYDLWAPNSESVYL